MTTSPSLAEEAAYDDAPYASHAFAATQPSRIAAVARLFGITTPEISTARVLELGGASGGNLIPLACRYPAARFLGIDISGRQVEEGQAKIAALGLQNIELRRQSITDFTDGPFDYIIAHGVLSWVPAEVQAALVRIAGRSLAPNGLAVISYNVLPGAYLRAPLRDMMLHHTDHIADPAKKVRAARDIIAQVAAFSGQAYGDSFAREFQNIPERADYYLLHEHLERVNDAWYFSDVVARMATAGLAYVAESDPWLSIPESFSSLINAEVRTLGGDDPIAIEQSLDYYIARRFRSSIFAPADHCRGRRFALTAASFAELQIGSNAPLVAYPEMPPCVPRLESNLQRFTARDAVWEVRSPLQSRLLTVLDERRATSGGTWSLPELLCAVTASPAPSAADSQEIIDYVAEMCLARGLYVFADAPAVSGITDRPCVFSLARLDAQQRRLFTANLFHESVGLTMPDMFHFLPLCDGTKTIAEINACIAALLAAGEIQLKTPGNSNGASLEHLAADWVQTELRKCVVNKLLVTGEAQIPGKKT